MAAAVGIGVNILEPKGNMIIDIGGGTTEIAVLAMGGIVCDKSIKVAGDVFTNDIANYMRTQHNLFVGERTAENIKISVGAALEDIEEAPEPFQVQGRDLLTGKPKQVSVSHAEVSRALEKSVTRIEDAIMEALSNTPPELAADIFNSGIYLAGGGLCFVDWTREFRLRPTFLFTLLRIHYAPLCEERVSFSRTSITSRQF